MPYYTPPTKSDGDILTVADWNVFVKGNFDHLVGGFAISRFLLGDYAFGTTPSPLAQTNLYVPLPIISSTNANFVDASYPERIVIPAAGIYSIDGKIVIDPAAAASFPLPDDEHYAVRVTKYLANGTADHYWEVKRDNTGLLVNSQSTPITIPFSAQFNLSAGDYLIITTFLSNSGDPLKTQYGRPDKQRSIVSPLVNYTESSATIVSLRDGV
jgi:hypothetical protein